MVLHKPCDPEQILSIKLYKFQTYIEVEVSQDIDTSNCMLMRETWNKFNSYFFKTYKTSSSGAMEMSKIPKKETKLTNLEV